MLLSSRQITFMGQDVEPPNAIPIVITPTNVSRKLKLALLRKTFFSVGSLEKMGNYTKALRQFDLLP